MYTMDKITLDNALPQIFHGRDMSASEVWQRSLTLERGGIYLIEAASGTGKTSLCSYLIGYRDDYEGRILFDNTDIRSLSVGQWVQARRTGLSHLFQELRQSLRHGKTSRSKTASPIGVLRGRWTSGLMLLV